MRRLMVCVKEREDKRLELGVFEEKGDGEGGDGTEAEAKYLGKLVHGMKVVLEEIQRIEGVRSAGVDIDDPWSELAMRVKARFQRKE